MEFLLVLPVYFVFIGGTFAVGEILVRAIHVTWAERVLAANCGSSFDTAAWTSVRSALFPSYTYEYEDEQMTRFSDFCTYSGNTLRADEGYKGAWSWQTAATVKDSHNRTPWTRGWLFSAANWLDAMTDDGSNARRRADEVVGETASKIGSLVSIASGERKERRYGYYTLVRTDLGRKARRLWEAKNLTDVGMLSVPVLDSEWFANIYNEEFAVSDPRELDRASQDPDELPEVPSRDDYLRFVMFMLWSQ